MPTVPEKDTLDVINAALDGAGIDAEGEITPDPEPDPDGALDPEPEPEPEVIPDGTEPPVDGELEPEPDAEAVEAARKAADKALNKDEFDALLDELGFRLPKAGQKENKVPVSRTRARMKTALKKYADKFGVERGEFTGKLTAADTELQIFRRADQAIAAGASNPAAARRYIEMLAAVHPAYKAFLGAGSGEPAKPAVPQALKDLGPKPGPDLKYEDGTVGFSPDQLEKRDEWLAASAEIRGYERSKTEFETRFGPMETAHKAAAARAEEGPRVEARITAIRDQWGEPFLAQERAELAKKGSSEIAQYQAAHPGVPFEQVVAAVLLPKLRADRTTMRAELITELNGKKKAAKPGLGQATKIVAAGGTKTTAEIIEEELAKAGL